MKKKLKKQQCSKLFKTVVRNKYDMGLRDISQKTKSLVFLHKSIMLEEKKNPNKQNPHLTDDLQTKSNKSSMWNGVVGTKLWKTELKN